MASAASARRRSGSLVVGVIASIVAWGNWGSDAEKDRERLPNRRSRSEGGRMEPKGFGPNRKVDLPDSKERSTPIKKPLPPETATGTQLRSSRMGEAGKAGASTGANGLKSP